MLAHTVRSGLVESLHRGSAIAVDGSGSVLFELGNPDRPIFYRSAVKPLQAQVAVEQGADLAPEEIAVISASHDALPIHVAYVEQILHKAGLDTQSLQTPSAWPLGSVAEARVRAAGHTRPQRIWHNCSGKHAGWLAACTAAGWRHDTYLDSAHPAQRRVRELVSAFTGVTPTPVGVDGCGAPTLKGSVRGLARAFARLSVDAEMASVSQPVHRFPALVGGSDRPDSKLGAWWDGPLKAGAEGLIGAGRHGIGIAVRSESGSLAVAVVGLAAVARRLGLLSEAAVSALRDVAAPPVFGGGRAVGTLDAILS